MAVTILVSIVTGVAAAAVLPLLLPAITHGVGWAAYVLLPLGIAASACSVVIDHACIAERQSRPAPMRNAGMAVMRLALLPPVTVFPLKGAFWIVTTFVVSVLTLDVVAVVRVLPRLHPGFIPTFSGWRAEIKAMRGLIAGHQVINVSAQSSTFVLPLIVAARIGPTENAFFYTTFMVSTAVFLVAPAISSALFAEGAHDVRAIERDLRRAARHIAMLAGIPAVVLLCAGDRVLGVFGPAYADAGATLLRVLVCSAVFDAAQLLSVAVLRARHQLREAGIATFTALVLAVGCAWVLLPPLGLVGAGVGWAVGKLGGATVGLYLMRRRTPVQGVDEPVNSLDCTSLA